MKHILFSSLVLISISLSSNMASAQNIGINADGSKPNANAMLDIKSYNKGLLIPRTSTTSRIAIPNTKGLLLYDTTTNSFWYNNGAKWNNLAGAGGTSPWATLNNNIYNTNTGNVGIGTDSPLARLHVADSSVVFSADGDINGTQSNVPISGAGRRMMWYPDRAAFRAGFVDGAQWDSGNIGHHSVAMGYKTIASGESSIAMGFQTTASGYASAAMGRYAQASGDYSTAMGFQTTASGYASAAMGTFVTTDNESGSFIIGDGADRTVYYSEGPNQMEMVFAGGYKLYTSANNMSISGVYMNGGDNSWSAISDSSKKEKIVPVNGEAFLQKISQFNLGSWNYKGQDAKTFRHYGPMAQDFHNAFGHDALGNIGCDTLINQQDFLGVSFIAIQALEKRTEKIEQQQKQIDNLQKENETLSAANQKQQQQLQTMLSTVAALDKKVETLAAVENKNNSVAKK